MLARPRRMTTLLVMAILALSATLVTSSVNIGLDLSETTVTWQRSPCLPAPIPPAIVSPRPEHRRPAQDRALPLKG
jgi:hypothetical protein